MPMNILGFTAASLGEVSRKNWFVLSEIGRHMFLFLTIGGHFVRELRVEAFLDLRFPIFIAVMRGFTISKRGGRVVGCRGRGAGDSLT